MNVRRQTAGDLLRREPDGGALMLFEVFGWAQPESERDWWQARIVEHLRAGADVTLAQYARSPWRLNVNRAGDYQRLAGHLGG